MRRKNLTCGTTYVSENVAKIIMIDGPKDDALRLVIVSCRDPFATWIKGIRIGNHEKRVHISEYVAHLRECLALLEE